MKSDKEIAAGVDLDERYIRQFGEYPPIKAWHGSPAALDKLMEEAIARDRALTAEELWAAQEVNRPPEHAKW